MIDMSHEYEVVGEMLEYFDSHKLATWAPLASIIRREREAAAKPLLEEIAKLKELVSDMGWALNPERMGQ